MKLSLKATTRWIFAVIMLFSIALGAFVIERLARVSDQTTIMGTIWAPRLQVTQQLEGAASDYRISEALRILSVSPEMGDHADQDLRANADLFTAKLTEYRGLLRPHESTAAIDNIASLWTDYVSSNVQMRQLAKDNKANEAADRYRNSASKFYLLTSALDDISKYNSDQSSNASTTAKRTGVQAIYGVLITLGVASIATVLTGVFFEKKVWSVLVRLAGVMQTLARGDLTAEISDTDRRDEVGEMARAVQVFKDNGLEMQRLGQEAEAQKRTAEAAQREHDDLAATSEAERDFVVSQIAGGLEALSNGDLTFRLSAEFAPAFEKLRSDFNSAVENLQETMTVISHGAGGIHSSTEEISRASDNLARRTEKQATSLEEVAAALEQITTTVRTSAERAKQAKAAVASATANADRSGEVVRSAVGAMSEIERSAQQISEIIGVMDEIAFQTNLLALNAGVEAARAGEAGRGFAVVAQEVRALAQRSTAAAREIKALISSSGGQVSAGVKLVGETGRVLEQIATQVSEVNGAIGDIALAAEEQASSLLQINTSVSQMDKVTQQNAAMAEESTAASHSLAQETNELARLIGQFDLGADKAPTVDRQSRLSSAKTHEPAPRKVQDRGRAVLRTMSSGGAALAASLERAISEEGWEEF